MLEVFLIALSLAMDAFAVSVSCGISVCGFTWRQAVKIGCWFGAFQFAMPLIGWVFGSGLGVFLSSLNHLLAFGVLSFIGVRMILEARGQAASAHTDAPLSTRRLTVLALATSIDALAVGVPMAFMTVNILLSAAVIGGVAFTLSVFGGLAGGRLGVLFRRRAAVAGGLVLIGMGIKFLVA